MHIILEASNVQVKKNNDTNNLRLLPIPEAPVISTSYFHSQHDSRTIASKIAHNSLKLSPVKIAKKRGTTNNATDNR